MLNQIIQLPTAASFGYLSQHFNTCRSEHEGRVFADDIFFSNTSDNASSGKGLVPGRQHTNTWTNVDPDLRCRIASLDHSC